MNENKNLLLKIMIPIIVSILLIGGVTYYYLFIKNKNYTSSINNNIISTSVLNKEDENINWSKYEEKEINLTESIKITSGGIYKLSGTISNGNIIIDTEDNVKLILNNVSITSSNSPAIIVENAKNVVIELADNSKNYLEDSSNYSSDYNDYDGVIYSKDDLYLTGNGSLEIKANHGDGIVSKDDLKISNGTYIINSKDDGIRGTDSVYIKDGDFTITSLGDGIKSTKEEDSEKGYVYIEGGNFKIVSSKDGISAITKLNITGGTFDIKTGNGSSSVNKSKSFGFGNQNTNTESKESMKGLKSDDTIIITGGTFTIDSEEDGIHSNNYIGIKSGNITINAGDDGIHADVLTEIDGGNITITSYEGIESTYIKINNGEININASDDGINASKKSDKYTPTVEINGGNITIKMASGDTDGIDSNGNIYINGGTINITGNSPFDYDGEGKLNGGKVIVNGSETTELKNQEFGGRGGNFKQGNGNFNPDDMPENFNPGERKGGMRHGRNESNSDSSNSNNGNNKRNNNLSNGEKSVNS